MSSSASSVAKPTHKKQFPIPYFYSKNYLSWPITKKDTTSARALQELTAQHYEPERHDRCYKWVWRKYVYPQFGICYHSYLRYLHTVVPAEV